MNTEIYLPFNRKPITPIDVSTTYELFDKLVIDSVRYVVEKIVYNSNHGGWKCQVWLRIDPVQPYA